MSNTLLLKRSGTANSVPVAGNLSLGELAINYTDGNLFYKNNLGSVKLLASSQFVSVTGNVTGGNLITTGLATVTGNVTGGNIITLGQISATGNTTANYFLGNGRQLSGIESFATIVVTGQSDVVANTVSSALTLSAGTGISITTDAGTDTVTIATVGTESIFTTGGDMGTVDEAVTASEDLGTITSVVNVSYDLGTIVVGGLIYPSQFVLPSFIVSALPPVTPMAQMIFVPDETSGAVPAFSDGTNWRRVTDRAIVS